MDPIQEKVYRSRSSGEGGSAASRGAEERLILVTNDDGFDAPGIAALVRAVNPLGRVVVAAPDREQSGTAHALTRDIPLRVFEAEPDRYRVTGTPTDCVHLAVTRLTGAVLLETHDEWAVDTRRYLSLRSLAELDQPHDDGMPKEVARARTLLLAS